jgi:hypothetical protein
LVGETSGRLMLLLIAVLTVLSALLNWNLKLVSSFCVLPFECSFSLHCEILFKARYLLKRKLTGPQNCFGEEKHFLVYTICHCFYFIFAVYYCNLLTNVINYRYDCVWFPCTCGKNLLTYKTCLFELQNVNITRQEFLSQLAQWMNLKLGAWNCI